MGLNLSLSIAVWLCSCIFPILGVSHIWCYSYPDTHKFPTTSPVLMIFNRFTLYELQEDDQFSSKTMLNKYKVMEFQFSLIFWKTANYGSHHLSLFFRIRSNSGGEKNSFQFIARCNALSCNRCVFDREKKINSISTFNNIA